MSKWKILMQYIKTKRRTFRSRTDLLAYQHSKIKSHLEYVQQNSPFYADLLKPYQKEISEQNWEALPVIDKKLMMEHFDVFNTVNITAEEAFSVALKAEETRDFSPKIRDVSIGLSSGTSGNRGIFLISDQERAMWSGTILAKLLPSSILRKHSIAFFLRANNNLYEAAGEGRISFYFFDLLDSLEIHKKRLNDIKPSIVVGPPSMLRMIAQWQNEGDIEITPVKMISVAEVLEEVDRHYIEKTFRQKLHNVYQCTEGFLAATCNHGTLHINEDIVCIHKQYIDKEHGVFMPIITDFTRTSQPIIRYQLNDLLVEKKDECPCGSPFMALERIDGRSDDLFWGTNKLSGEKVPIFPDFLRRAVMAATDRINEYKVIQTNWIEIAVMIKGDGEQVKMEQEVKSKIWELWDTLSLNRPQVIFQTYDEKLSHIKRKRIESRLRQNHES
ncbi:F390 synthetase-related protein [Bacillus mesophilum]|uniref:Adenylate cyclase n=1 Tax=Bacillus mesophilum TaxID=1071718 RepID=A0A7V7RQR9_9BACI|nr:F390 synthetase-related protein [Bacillus mesophilum]KAB2335819.1 adenylate cyclase [Bacillus mesophilum]